MTSKCSKNENSPKGNPWECITRSQEFPEEKDTSQEYDLRHCLVHFKSGTVNTKPENGKRAGMEKIVQEIQTACVASTKSNVGKQSEKNDAFMEQHRKDK